jgi:hypothetical protein
LVSLSRALAELTLINANTNVKPAPLTTRKIKIGNEHKDNIVDNLINIMEESSQKKENSW